MSKTGADCTRESSAVRFPLQAEHIRLQGKRRLPHAPLTILLVDDEAALLQMIHIALEGVGHNPIAASSGKDALTIFHKIKIDLVVSDLKMRPMDGFELLKNIRTIDPDLPVILISGDRAPTLPYRAFQEGADDFLHKPFSLAGLYEAVDRCCLKRNPEILLVHAN